VRARKQWKPGVREGYHLALPWVGGVRKEAAPAFRPQTYRPRTPGGRKVDEWVKRGDQVPAVHTNGFPSVDLPVVCQGTYKRKEASVYHP
jgi:hypothetical protein